MTTDADVVSTRQTSDGISLMLHSDGSISDRRSYVGRSKLPRDKMWRVWEDISLYTRDEVPDLIKAVRRGTWMPFRVRPDMTEERHQEILSSQVRTRGFGPDGVFRIWTPTKNPDMVENPPWVGRLLAESYEVLEEEVPARWLPRLDTVKPGSGGSIVGRVKEYGCGVYGCVLPTLDPGVVLKLTTDDTEAQFAADLAETLVEPICVEYKMVMRLASRHEGRTVHLLWRESAEDVGKLDKVLGKGALALVDEQHAAAQDAYRAISEGRGESLIRMRVSHWLERCEAMARQTKVPELRPLGEGLVEVYAQQRIVFGDIHAGNLGRVERETGSAWVITDPGNIAVLEAS